MSSTQSAAPPQHDVNELVSLLNRGQYDDVCNRAGSLLRLYPASVTLWNLLGASSAQSGQFDIAEQAFPVFCADCDEIKSIGRIIVTF